MTTRVIGVGNADRGDDAAGLLAVRALSMRLPPGVEVAETDGEPARLIDLLGGVDRVILVDASSARDRPGLVRRLNIEAVGDARCTTTSHRLGLPDAVLLAAALGIAPEAVVYTVEGQSFEPGAGVSPEVERGIRIVARQILREVRPTGLR